MINIKTILCPTDLTTESDEALRYAVALTQVYGAQLMLLHCVESTAREADDRDPSRKKARLFGPSLAHYLGLAESRTLDWDGLVVENVDDIGNTIVEQASEHKVDLIVMRSRRRPRAAVLLGSTAETVCRSAPCPVLVTHPREREWVGRSTGEIDLQRIMVAYDFSPDADVALKYGISLAQEYQTELHLVQVVSKAEAEDLDPEAAQANENAYANAAYKLQLAIPKEAFLWCKIFTAIRGGKVHQEVLAYATEHEIDLVCIGVSGTGSRLGTLFGSNVDRVLREAPCPVLVARPLKWVNQGLRLGLPTSELETSRKNTERTDDNPNPTY